MIELKRILLVDDNPDDELGIDELKKNFEDRGIQIIFCTDKDEAIMHLDAGIHFDLIILDWFLEEENHLLSQLFLTYLNNKKFLPVFMWSNHIDNFKSTFENGEVNYPGAMITTVAKNEISPQNLQQKVSEWFQNLLAAQISKIGSATQVMLL